MTRTEYHSLNEDSRVHVPVAGDSLKRCKMTYTRTSMLNQTAYNSSFVYCLELAPGTVNLTGDWVRGDDSKQYRYYTCKDV